jgi:hypothetical protein
MFSLVQKLLGSQKAQCSEAVVKDRSVIVDMARRRTYR